MVLSISQKTFPFSYLLRRVKEDLEVTRCGLNPPNNKSSEKEMYKSGDVVVFVFPWIVWYPRRQTLLRVSTSKTTNAGESS